MRQNKATILGITFVVLGLMVVLLVLGNKLNQRLTAGDARLTSLTEQIQNEDRRTEEIRKMQEYMKTDEYQEQVAKEKLGLVNDGDIVFKEADD